jgi:prepilin-type N-terminal cleavage/methylation domain-containing protein
LRGTKKQEEVDVMKYLKERGFTLVEMAIVLVIIGLLLGAVLRGSQLVRNARVKALANDLRGYYAAVYTFMDKNGRLPGDNNRDGIMENDAIPDLANQGIASRKSSPWGANYYIKHRTGIPAPSGSISANVIYVSNIPVSVARQIDDQIDDGLADGTAGNDSGRKSGSFRYSGTSGNVTVYYLLD